MSYEKKIYNPGLVGCYQKPWFTFDAHCGARYCGQFSDAWHHISVKYVPITKLIKQVKDPILKDKLLELVEEMQDACYACSDEHTRSLPSCD
jgi:hypothetical protein